MLQNNNKNSLSTNVVPGSMLDQARKKGIPLANTWMNCKIVLICDVSGSMSAEDGRDGLRRFDVLVQQVRAIQEENPGGVAIVSFSSNVAWQPNGNPEFFKGGTNMLKALQYVKSIDGTPIRITLLSDGEPDFGSEQKVINFARAFVTKIDTIYIGPEDKPRGRDFLQQLAAATGGVHQDDFKVKNLQEKVRLLISG